MATINSLRQLVKTRIHFLSLTIFLISSVLTIEAWAQPLPDAEDPGFLSVIAGGADDGAGSPALTYPLDFWIAALDVDDQGRVYFENHGKIRRMDRDGNISDFSAGNNVVDLYIQGNKLYYIEGSDKIFRVDLGNGSTAFMTPVLPEEDTSYGNFSEIAVDSNENIYVYDCVILRIDSASGEATHFGNGCSFDSEPYESGVPASEADILVTDMAIDPADDSLLIADWLFNRISRIDPKSGIVTIVADEVIEGSDTISGTNRLFSLDILPQGDIVFTDGNSHLWTVSENSDTPVILAGDGISTTAGDGKSLLEASIQPHQVAVDNSGNIYSTSAIRRGIAGEIVDQRIRFLDLENDIVSSVIGAPGLLACQSPTDSLLQEMEGITVDTNGISYVMANSAILAVDTRLDVLYSVAGLYGTRGDSEDGEPAFGNPIAPDGVDILAVAPDEDIYFPEVDRLRRINHVSGLLETVTEGQFRWLDFSDHGALYAVRQYYRQSFDYIDEGIPDFVKIDVETGVVSTLVAGGELPVNAGEPASGRDFRSIADFSVDSNENIYLLLGDNQYGNDGVVSGIYVIDNESGLLNQLVNLDELDFRLSEGFWFNATSRLAFDEKQGLIYVTDLLSFSGPDVAVLRYTIESGEVVHFAGSDDADSFSENPLESEMHPIAVDLGPNGELYLIDRGDDSQYVLKISSSPGNTLLVPEDINSGANVGIAVARSGEWMAIGVPNSDSGNGSTGEVLVYRDNGCRPILRNRLKTPGGQTTHKLGQLVTFSGDALIVGSSEEQTQTTQSESSFLLGTFLLEDGNWQFDQDLTGLLPAGAGDSAMTLVSDGNRFAVGVTAANGGQGEVLVFDSKKLQAPSIVQSNSDVTRFGLSLAMSDGRLAIGANSNQGGGVAELFQYEGSSYQFLDVARGDAGRPAYAAALALNDQALYVGSPDASGGRVFGFTISDQSMQLSDTLKDPEDADNPSFGSALAIEDGVLVVGAPETNVAAVQSKQSQLETSGGSSKPNVIPGTGAIHIFGIKDGSGRGISGIRLFSLLASAAEAYGKSVDISNGRIVVGAPKTNNGRGTFESVGEVVNAAALSGLWYDPALEGEGFNVLVADAGLVVYFYGYDSEGERLWLVSETLTGEFGFGEDINLKVYKAREGEFVSPVSSSESLVEYGLLSLSFGSLTSARFTITGFDGGKFSSAVFLADAGANGAVFSGLWYDSQKDGEGFNVISGAPGTIIYYYGSSDNGERLWLISDLLSNDIEEGTTLKGKMFEATGGDFYHPAPTSTALKEWGSIEARFDDCNDGRFILSGSDGYKTSDVFKLAGVDGVECQ